VGREAAIPTGQDKIRAFHPIRYIQDEAPFLPDGEECLSAVIPTGAYIICISTARAGWFADQCSQEGTVREHARTVVQVRNKASQA